MSNIKNKSKSNLDQLLFTISLRPSGGGSLQKQLLAQLRDLISRTNGLAGERMPASRVFAQELCVSRTTVQIVYDQLISEGYLETKIGSGTFIAREVCHLANPVPQHSRKTYQLEPWQPFTIGIPDLANLPHEQWSRALERSWRQPPPELLAKSDPMGWHPLREAIAQHLGVWRNLECDAGQVVITSGAYEGLELVLRTCAGPKSGIALENPCWPRMRRILERLHCATAFISIDAQGLDAKQISDHTGAVIVTPSRHYPTGISMPLARRMALIDWARNTGGLIIEDDYDSEFRYKGQPLPSLSGLDGLENTVYLGSFSKLMNPNLCLGYLVLPKGRVDAIRQELLLMGARASMVVQPAMAQFMNDGSFATHLRRMRRIYARRQRVLLTNLEPVRDLLDLKADDSGMHLCLGLTPKLRNYSSDNEIQKQAAKIDLRVAALSNYYHGPAQREGLLLGYAGFSENVLQRAAGELAALLRQICA